MAQNSVLELLSKNVATLSLEKKKGSFVVDDTVGVSLLFASLFSKNPGNYLIIASNLYNAQKITSLIASLIGSDNILLFPYDDLLRTELLASSKEMLAQRLYVLHELDNIKKRIIVTHASAIIAPLPLKSEFKNYTFTLEVGKRYSLDEIKNKLVHAGYLHVNKIDQSLEFASRGDILDIFSVNYLKPIRIEFFGDEIESIHYFDIATQESGTSLNEATIIPATDALISDLEINRFKENAYAQIKKDKEILGENIGDYLSTNVELDIEKIINRTYTPRTYKYYRYIKQLTASVLDYLDADITFIANKNQFDSTIEFLEKEAREYLYDMFSHGKILSHLELYLDADKCLKNEKHLLYGNEFKVDADDIEFNTAPLVFSKMSVSNLKIIITSYLDNNDKVVLALANKQQLETIDRKSVV